MQDAGYWIEKLGLEAHPEGGHFRETYRSAENISACALPGRFDGERSFSTAIYFLLRQGEVSTFHRIHSDEIWFWHAGGALTLFVIQLDGRLFEHRLGPDPENAESFQWEIPAGAWFAARPLSGVDYVLVSCTVSPGFDFADFELASGSELSTQFPQYRALIAQLS
jgi:uncharacterized protein